MSPAVREAMIADPRLPADCRHMLLVKLGEALKSSRAGRRADRRRRTPSAITRDACAKACVTLIEGTRIDEHAALIEHLRLRGDLTPAFIIRAVAHGKIDFFGSVLVALTGRSEQRVTTTAGRRARCRRRCAVPIGGPAGRIAQGDPDGPEGVARGGQRQARRRRPGSDLADAARIGRERPRMPTSPG